MPQGSLSEIENAGRFVLVHVARMTNFERSASDRAAGIVRTSKRLFFHNERGGESIGRREIM